MKKYKDLTSSNTLQNCFKGGSIVNESRVWFRTFRNIIQRSFPKIRISENYVYNNQEHMLMAKKTALQEVIGVN